MTYEELVKRLEGIIAHAMRGLPTAQDAAEACLRDIAAAGLVIVPREPTEEMMEAIGEDVASDAYDAAVLANKKTHEELMAKYPHLVKPKDKFGAAGVQTLPVIWRAMIAAAPNLMKGERGC